MTTADQTKFESCYRGRHHWIFHLAYLRSAKVCLLEKLIAGAGMDLSGARILDYGFGAGSFFRRCPRSAFLYGVELDSVSVGEVSAGLRARGHLHVDLCGAGDSSALAEIWPDMKFDLIVCSHVLEHVTNPVDFLRDLSARLAPGGRILCLVPINEIGDDPKHATRFHRASLEATCRAADLSPGLYVEGDEWMYWIQPAFLQDGRGWRLLMQALSFGLGLAFCAPGWRFWDFSGKIWARLTDARPSQAGVVLSA